MIESNGPQETFSFKNSVEKPLYHKKVRIQMIEDIESKKIQTPKQQNSSNSESIDEPILKRVVE